MQTAAPRHLVALPNPPRRLAPAMLHTVATLSTDTLPDDRLDALTFNVQLAILGHIGAGAVHDDLLFEVISEAVGAFLMESGRPVKAAQRVSPLLRSIGSREAVIGRDADDFAESFQIARVVILEELPGLLCDHLLTPAAALALRGDVLIFLDQLHTHAREGFDHAQSLARIPAALTSDTLYRSLFANGIPIDPVKFRTMATLAGLTMSNEAVPVITMGTAFPAGFVDDSRVIGGPDPHEAIVCSTVGEIALITLAAGADCDVLILGPAVLLHDLPRSLGLARRAAAMLNAGLLRPTGTVLRCADVLGDLVSFADPFVSHLLVRKHLGSLSVLAPERRLDLAELLLAWLESGTSVNKLARSMNLHTQTMHGRIRKLRELLGTALDDPDRRVELILALRAALPGWRHEVHPSSTAPVGA